MGADNSLIGIQVAECIAVVVARRNKDCRIRPDVELDQYFLPALRAIGEKHAGIGAVIMLRGRDLANGLSGGYWTRPRRSKNHTDPADAYVVGAVGHRRFRNGANPFMLTSAAANRLREIPSVSK